MSDLHFNEASDYSEHMWKYVTRKTKLGNTGLSLHHSSAISVSAWTQKNMW